MLGGDGPRPEPVRAAGMDARPGVAVSGQLWGQGAPAALQAPCTVLLGWSGQHPSQTVLGSEATWPSVRDEAPRQVEGGRMCGWLRWLRGRVAQCPR